ncbi:hypothetical protein JB92DRAFT_2911286 [Gautieria morchelliformis]|nr:hypothetical protein JB92DRAFT_2911286 [Gautieria morchelliformis]
MCEAMCMCAAGSNVSFREGLAPDGSTTFCPRLLLINYKSKSNSAFKYVLTISNAI